MNRAKWIIAIEILVVSSCIAYGIRYSGGQTPPVDPGLRLGPADVGGSLPGLSGTEITFFTSAQAIFEEVDSVSGGLSGEDGRGLGPRFNSNSCAGCHVSPAIGGTSPSVNPQIAVASLHGATNTMPSFVTSSGPIVEARFLSDGQVHQLFTIAGRSDAPGGCTLAQPTFAPGAYQLRIPTPTFGLGLVENTTDDNLRAAQNPSLAGPLGIATGVFNIAADSTIARFGWKAQNKSITMFAGEAYNVEIGVSNEVFPNEIVSGACEPNTTPEDLTTPAGGNSDVSMFSGFIRLLAPPTPEPGGYTTASATVSPASITNGQTLFQSVGCQACHVMTQTTTTSPYTGQSNITYHPMSDFALHSMGANLQDGIAQGAANGTMFRTAPLWGLGKRIFLLHDGRTKDLYASIISHRSTGSEAIIVINNFDLLTVPQQQDILNYLRSL